MKIIALILVLFGVFASSAYACTCIDLTQEEKFDQADHIFTGKVLKYNSVDNKEMEYIFEVSNAYKGIVNEEIAVRSAKHAASCGVDMELNQYYLVYANKEEDGNLYTGICQGTASMKNAANQMNFLDEKKKSEQATVLEGSEREKARQLLEQYMFMSDEDKIEAMREAGLSEDIIKEYVPIDTLEPDATEDQHEGGFLTKAWNGIKNFFSRLFGDE